MEIFEPDGAGPRVVFGAGSLAEVPAEVARLGRRRVLLIAGRHEKPHADGLASALAPAGRIEDVVVHVPAATAAAGVRAAEEAGADLLVCVGGGSATGLAKAIAKQTGIAILAVPTTYAGSELNPVWGVTADGRKTTGRDPRVLPRVVVYDPELTLSLPPDVSAASGMNAIAHAVEALYAADAAPATRSDAEQGVEILAAALPAVVARPGDLPARTAALRGAWRCGAALAGTEMGIHHTICHVLGGAYALPHAATHAAVLPHAVACVEAFAPTPMSRLAAALGTPRDPAEALWDLAARLDAPTSLAQLGFRHEDVDVAADLVVAAAASKGLAGPRPVEREWVAELLLAAWDGARPQDS
ncbi:MAG TPA: maleylacetate reductase [Streptosporangiaceae bacterium]|nr:maleylacetate reductase [Streptosporangiaceae bacterium]